MAVDPDVETEIQILKNLIRRDNTPISVDLTAIETRLLTVENNLQALSDAVANYHQPDDPIDPPPPPPPSPTTGYNYLGTGFSGVGLSDLNFKGSSGNLQYASSFIATQNGNVSSVQKYITWEPGGYGAGDGGNLTVEIRPSDPAVSVSGYDPDVGITTGTLPSGGGPHASTVLATMTINGPVPGWSGGPYAYATAATFTFVSPAAVTEGNRYWIVITNNHASPSSNFCSAESLRYGSGAYQKDYVLNRIGSGWYIRNGSASTNLWNEPLQVIHYDDGEISGHGYMHAIYYSWSQHYIGGNYKVRQTGAMTGSIDEVYIHVGRRLAGDLLLSVDGAPVVTGVEQTGRGSYDPTTNGPPWGTSTGETERDWYKFMLPSTVVDPSDFTFSSTTNQAFVTGSMKKGVGLGFPAASMSAGHAEYSTNNGASWQLFLDWGTPTTIFDLMWYAPLV